MTCHRIQSRLSAFLDGELTAQEQQRIQNHVESCRNSRAVLSHIQKVEAFLDDGVTLEPDPFLLTRVKASRSPAQWIRAAAQKTAALAAGLLVGIVLGIQLNTLAAPQHAVVESPKESTPTYSVIDPNIYEPMPSGSITATYVSASMSK